jgi:hypothetical protein
MEQPYEEIFREDVTDPVKKDFELQSGFFLGNSVLLLSFVFLFALPAIASLILFSEKHDVVALIPSIILLSIVLFIQRKDILESQRYVSFIRVYLLRHDIR